MEEKKEIKIEEPKIKETRLERRLKAKKAELLETLINLFFADRSVLADPEGKEAAEAFVKYRNMWIATCKSFNRSKNHPFTLRGEAFTDRVNQILEIEKAQKQKTKAENEIKDFEHWFRRAGLWYKNPGRFFWYWLISWGNHERKIQLWKHHYLIHIINEGD